MSWWAWIVALMILGWGSVQLRRAVTVGRINAGIGDFSRSESPGFFWFQVSMVAITVGVFGGCMLIIAADFLALI